MPEIPIYLSFPNAPSSFLSWLHKIPSCVYSWDQELWNQHDPSMLQSWNIKAHLLLHLLEAGHQEVWWIDSDILVTKNFIPLYQNLSNDTFVICEEALYGHYEDNGKRTEAWNLPVGKRPPFCYNTGVIRATQKHKPLIKQWGQLLYSADYLQAGTSCSVRPFHLFGDQDVLTALLGSKEYENLALKIIRRGEGIIQYFGFSAYTTHERLYNLIYGMPAFIHSQGWKPWLPLESDIPSAKLKNKLKNLYIQLSPYRIMASEYKDLLAEPSEWIDSLTWTARIFQVWGFNSPPLTGLPLAMAIDLVRLGKKIIKTWQ